MADSVAAASLGAAEGFRSLVGRRRIPEAGSQFVLSASFVPATASHGVGGASFHTAAVQNTV